LEFLHYTLFVFLSFPPPLYLFLFHLSFYVLWSLCFISLFRFILLELFYFVSLLLFLCFTTLFYHSVSFFSVSSLFHPFVSSLCFYFYSYFLFLFSFISALLYSCVLFLCCTSFLFNLFVVFPPHRLISLFYLFCFKSLFPPSDLSLWFFSLIYYKIKRDIKTYKIWKQKQRQTVFFLSFITFKLQPICF
jgi:hypothetical protein